MFKDIKTFFLSFFYERKLLKHFRKTKYINWQSEFEKMNNSFEHPLDPLKLKKIGLKVLVQTWAYSSADLSIETNEKDDINRIISYFGLEENKISQYKNKVGIELTNEYLKQQLDNNNYTKDDADLLIFFENEFNIPHSKVEEILKKKTEEFYIKAVKQAILDNEVTKEEFDNINKLARDLDIDTSKVLDHKTSDTLDYLVMMEALNNGFLPTIDTTSIVLQKAETAYLETSAELLTSKVITTGHTGSSSGISLRIMKGMQYRMGGYRGHSVKENVTIRTPGNLVITSKRVVFASIGKSFSIPFTQLLSIEPYTDGIGLQKNNISYTLKLPNNSTTEITCKVLTNAINKNLQE